MKKGPDSRKLIFGKRRKGKATKTPKKRAPKQSKYRGQGR